MRSARTVSPPRIHRSGALRKASLSPLGSPCNLHGRTPKKRRPFTRAGRMAGIRRLPLPTSAFPSFLCLTSPVARCRRGEGDHPKMRPEPRPPIMDGKEDVGEGELAQHLTLFAQARTVAFLPFTCSHARAAQQRAIEGGRRAGEGDGEEAEEVRRRGSKKKKQKRSAFSAAGQRKWLTL